jgi:ParB family chromosome partitioning protein
LSLIENIRRKRLFPLEEAHAFKLYASDYGWGGILDLSLKIGKSVSYVTKCIKLLKLREGVLKLVKNNKLNESIAEELCQSRTRIHNLYSQN